MMTDPALQRAGGWAMTGLGAVVAVCGAVAWWFGTALGPMVDGWSMAGAGSIVGVVGLWQLCTAIEPDDTNQVRLR